MKVSSKQLLSRIQESINEEELSDSLIQLGHEHEIKDGIFDFELTPNRGDCLSVNGLLRDLNVFYDVDINQEIYEEEIEELSIDFQNLSKDLCSNISFLKLKIDKIPEVYSNSLQDYFLDLDLNKNNFFTDVSNFLSHETGQPTHCYDSNKINGKLIFHEKETNDHFETLLGKNIVLSNKNAVFTLDNKIINLPGVMGGKSTACIKDTKTVIVECAHFKPEAIIGKSLKYDLNSEASHKYERGVDPLSQEKVLRRFIKIVSEHTNITDMSLTSFKFQNYNSIKIPLCVEKINKIIGTNISRDECLEHLTKLGFCITEDQLEVPSYRTDIKNQNDIAEEIARVVGYDNIIKSEITIPSNRPVNFREAENKLRYFLTDNGFYEVINTPFAKKTSDNAINVDNPLDSNRKLLRTDVVNSLIDNLIYNENRQKDSVKLFEISDVYTFKSGITKKRVLSIIASGRLGLNYEEFSKKINIEYFRSLMNQILPEKSLEIKKFSRDSLDSKAKSEIITLEFDIESIADELSDIEIFSKPPSKFHQYKAISEFPSSFKDISFLIENSSKTHELENLLLNYKSDIIKHVFIFDYYYNEKLEEIKIGFRFIFQSKNQTLKSEQIDKIYNDIIKKSTNISGVSIPGL